ncbi:junctophilin-1 isoform X1 [Euwallacea fornicatus]|uniref:junctophilin-1 isoform X1 n=2 Tax=Euwallacea fornicatus TaxID=995702 RepID=UPI0033904F62
MQQQQPSDNGGAPPGATGATGTAAARSHVNGGRFDFDDGGTYCGGWEDGKAHGHGVCTGPKGQGAYSGSWHYGFEVSGVYTWPSGSCFEGQWQNGKRHGLGVETRGRWIYRGEWTQGFKGRYGVRQSNTSTAKYQGTWANGLQDGYGSETYADDGTYQGQWMRGMRHGYGVRTSAPFGKASKYRGQKALRGSMTSLRSSEPGAAPQDAAEKRDRRVDDSRGGFVLQSNSTEPAVGSRRRSLGSGNIKKHIFKGILKKGASTGELDRRTASGSIRSNASSASYISTDSAGSVMTNNSMPSDSNASFVIDDEQMDPSVTETYMGEWSNDKRSGYGISERSDGLKYEGEWYANKKYGYGVTTFANGEKEEGKYKNNVLITSQKKRLFLVRSAKFRERIDAAVNAAQRASKIALQKADIAISRTATARGKAEQADGSAAQARIDSEIAETVAKQYAPDFKQPGLERLKRQMKYREKNLELSFDQKEADAANALNQIPNQAPNQMPNRVNSEISNQIPNKINKPNVGNQIPNQMGNSTQAYQMNQQQPTTYQQPQQGNPYSMQNSYPQQPQQNSYQSQQAKPFASMNNPGLNNPGINNPVITNPGIGNPYGNASSHLNEFGPQIPNANQNSGSAVGNKNASNDLGVPLHNPRNSITGENVPNANSIRRMSRRVSGERPYLGSIGQQSSIDHFDHYKRPPSRDSSVDRYSRATGRLSNSMTGSRQPSVDRTSAARLETPDRTLRAPSAARGTTPTPSGVNNSAMKNGSVPTGVLSGQSTSPVAQNNSAPPFEDVILRKRGLGQDIIPSPNQPKRTESLFIPGQPNAQAAKVLATQTSLQRKKSLPDVQDLPRATRQMPREEVSMLGSARREEIRRQIDERERLRANPLLYLVSPQVKDWFSRQQLVLVVLFINISLAIMFFKLLT